MPRSPKMLLLASLVFVLALPAARADEKQPPATATATAPADLVVWDGETHKIGGGWVDHKDKETIKSQDAQAHSGKTAVEFTGDGDKWHGCGWNWTMWKAAAATDVTPYANLVFWAKATGETKPAGLRISLSSVNGKMTAQVDAVKYCPQLLDGQWHQVVIPLKDMTAGHDDFDPKKVWEIQLGNWNQTPVKFSVFLDDLAFSNSPAEAAK